MSFQDSFNWATRKTVSFGEKPGLWRSVEEDLQFLKENEVRAILSFVEEEPRLALYREAGFEAHHVPVEDLHAPTMDQLKECVNFILENQPIYVHCYGGYGRSGTIAAAWLIWNGMAAIDAVRTIRILRPGAIEADAQFDVLIEYASRVHGVNLRSRGEHRD